MVWCGVVWCVWCGVVCASCECVCAMCVREGGRFCMCDADRGNFVVSVCVWCGVV